MSHDESLRAWTQRELVLRPDTPLFTPQKEPDYHDRMVINNEIERIRQQTEWEQREKRGY